MLMSNKGLRTGGKRKKLRPAGGVRTAGMTLVAALSLAAGAAPANAAFATSNHWHTGFGVHVDWSDPQSPVAACDGLFATYEGSSGYSDPLTGASVIQTDGTIAYNGAEVSIGTDLGGSPSSTQSAVVMPVVGQPGQFWVFGTPGQEQPGNGHAWRIGTPSAGVVADAGNLHTNVDERLAIVPHANGVDAWVLYSVVDNNLLTIYGRKISGTTLGAEFEVLAATQINPGAGAERDPVGSIVASPDYTKLAVTMFTSGYLMILDFDNATGQATWSSSTAAPLAYGAAFAPDGSSLYVTYIISNTLAQHDVATGEQIASTTLAGLAGGIALAPDGYLYVSVPDKASLTRIEDASLVPMTAANVTTGHLPVTGTCTYQYNLPTFRAGAAVISTDVCGDGDMTGPEACDDGNTTNDDGCDANCTITACGNGVITSGEDCDDGNLDELDGCSSACGIDDGFTCDGEPSACTTVCGDGIPAGAEACDDGNEEPGDGCNACAITIGYACDGAPSVCAPICGDGIRRAPEGCDDGGVEAGDGCSPTCQPEHGYVCGRAFAATGGGGCRTICGDGLVAGAETCDDGVGPDEEPVDGDGCSAACLVETFWSCAGEPSACAPDLDGDGAGNDADNCPVEANPLQEDVDSDGLGDACDPRDDRDIDTDGVFNEADNCAFVANADQADGDGDGLGNVCDTTDGTDVDTDDVTNAADNCPFLANADQLDTDGDGLGDVCDPSNSDDVDGDGVANAADNCPFGANADQVDADGDGFGDACDGRDDDDADGDGVAGEADNCPFVANAEQADADGDGTGDVCDSTVLVNGGCDAGGGAGGSGGVLALALLGVIARRRRARPELG